MKLLTGGLQVLQMVQEMYIAGVMSFELAQYIMSTPD